MSLKRVCLVVLIFVLYISTNVVSEGLIATEGKPITVRTYVRIIDPNATNSSYEDSEDVKSIEDTKRDIKVEMSFFDILAGYVFGLLYSIFNSLSAFILK